MPPELRSRRRASLRPRKLSNKDDKPMCFKKTDILKKKLKRKAPVIKVKNPAEKGKSQVINNQVNIYPISEFERIKQNIVFHSGSSRYVRVDDDDGHLNFDLGDVLIERYRLVGFLGKGTFGRVARAVDLLNPRFVAIKIVKNEAICRDSGRTEIHVMERLNCVDPQGKNHWVKMLDHFEFWGHVFIVFEMLAEDLYTFMKDIKRPFLLFQVKHIAYQLVKSVHALHNNLMIHTDLKPENICFLNASGLHLGLKLRRINLKDILDSTIRLIDFGSTIHLTDVYRGVIQTRHYRCPEVIYGMRWSYASDVWSIGCILFELYTGTCMFLVNTDEEHIKAMEETLGPMPPLFKKNASLNQSKDGEKKPIKRLKKCKPLRNFMKSSSVEHQHFFEFLEECLIYDPYDRMKLNVALKHPFLASLPPNLKA